MRFGWLVLIAALFPNSGSARLRGDWGSAGDPPVPYVPGYEYRYGCQAELTDLVDRQGSGKGVPKGRPYRLYSVAHFSFTPGHASWNGSGEVTWIAKLLDAPDPDSDEIALSSPPREALSFSGSYVALNFQRGADTAHDKVNLYASVPVPIGHYYANGTARDEATRTDSNLSVRAEATLYRGEGEAATLPSEIERSLFVDCVKGK